MRDKVAQARIRIRLRQAQVGNFGDVEPVDGVSEFRIHVGAGYRVYYGRHGKRSYPALRWRQVEPDGRHQTRQGVLVRMEAEAIMGTLKRVISHHEREIAELRADREVAVEYLKAAMESLDRPETRAAGLLALRTVAEAYGDLSAAAAEAGMTRESLSRALSPNGNPTLKTLLAVLKTIARCTGRPKCRVSAPAGRGGSAVESRPGRAAPVRRAP